MIVREDDQELVFFVSESGFDESWVGVGLPSELAVDGRVGAVQIDR